VDAKRPHPLPDPLLSEEDAARRAVQMDKDGAERLRVDIPTRAPLESLTARLLDRQGRPLAIPVTLSQREEAGVRYATGEVVLSPLALGDYLVEIALGPGQRPETIVVAFRMVP